MGAHCYGASNALSALAAAAFTPGSGPSDATRSYLNDARMDRQYIFTAATTNRIDIDMGSAVSLEAIALLNHNLATLVTPTVTITATSNADYVTGAVTVKATSAVTAVAPDHKDHVFQFTAVSKRYWRIALAWNGTSQVVKLGEIYAISAVTTLSRRSIWGSGEGEQFAAVSTEMQYGETVSAFMGGPVRTKRLQFADLTAAEKLELRAMWAATQGPVSPFLFIESKNLTADASASGDTHDEECLFGFQQQTGFDWTQDDYAIYQVPSISLRSRGREVGA